MSEPTQVEHSTQTREKILANAARLFSTQGYENTSLSQVAREANVSKALIFWHFDSKEKLYRAALGLTLEPYFINVESLQGLDEGEQLERLVDLFYEFVRHNTYSVRFLFGLVLRGENQTDEALERVRELYRVFRSLLTDTIESGRRSGCFHAEVRPELDAALLLASLDGILIEHFMHGEFPEHPSELLTHLKRTALQRLRAR